MEHTWCRSGLWYGADRGVMGLTRHAGSFWSPWSCPAAPYPCIYPSSVLPALPPTCSFRELLVAARPMWAAQASSGQVGNCWAYLPPSWSCPAGSHPPDHPCPFPTSPPDCYPPALCPHSPALYLSFPLFFFSPFSCPLSCPHFSLLPSYFQLSVQKSGVLIATPYQKQCFLGYWKLLILALCSRRRLLQAWAA